MARLRCPLGAWRLVDDVEAGRGVIDGVRPTPGRTRGSERRLSKLKRFLNRPIPTTETATSSMFYSQLTPWFWLKVDPLDRATRDLQVCLQDQSLIRPGLQSTKLSSDLPRNCTVTDLGKFG